MRPPRPVFGAGNRRQFVKTFPAKVQQTNDVHVRVMDHTLYVTLNGQAVIQNWQRSIQPEFMSMVGVGGLFGVDGAKVRFSELKIRRLNLPENPPAPPGR